MCGWKNGEGVELLMQGRTEGEGSGASRTRDYCSKAKSLCKGLRECSSGAWPPTACKAPALCETSMFAGRREMECALDVRTSGGQWMFLAPRFWVKPRATSGLRTAVHVAAGHLDSQCGVCKSSANPRLRTMNASRSYRPHVIGSGKFHS